MQVRNTHILTVLTLCSFLLEIQLIYNAVLISAGAEIQCARKPYPRATSPAWKCPTAHGAETNTGVKKHGTDETEGPGRVANLWADSSRDPSLNPEQPAKRRGSRKTAGASYKNTHQKAHGYPA